MRHTHSRERALLKIASDSTFRGMVETCVELGEARPARHAEIANVLELAQTAERGRICDVLLVGHRASRWRPGRRKLIRMLYDAIAEPGDPTFPDYLEHQGAGLEHQETPLSERLEGGPIEHPVDPPGFELKTAPPRDDRDESQVGLSLGR